MTVDYDHYRYQPLGEDRYRVWYMTVNLGEANSLEEAVALADEHQATYERGDQ